MSYYLIMQFELEASSIQRGQIIDYATRCTHSKESTYNGNAYRYRIYVLINRSPSNEYGRYSCPLEIQCPKLYIQI